MDRRILRHAYIFLFTGILVLASLWPVLGVSGSPGVGGAQNESSPIAWSETYGGPSEDHETGLAHAPGGYVISGVANQRTADVKNAWLVRIAGNGTERWNSSFGGHNREAGTDVIARPDGSFLLAGWIGAGNRQSRVGWLVKVDDAGAEQWNLTYPRYTRQYNWSVYAEGEAFEPNYDQQLDVYEYRFQEIIPAYGDGYLILGNRNPTFQGKSAVWITRIGPNGTERWNRTYRTNDGSADEGLVRTPDGYVIGGVSGGCQVSHPCREEAARGWLLKIDRSGDCVWDRTYGSTSHNGFETVARLPDSDVFAGGLVQSEPPGMWALRVGPAGTVRWNRTYPQLGALIQVVREDDLVGVGRGDTNWSMVTLTHDGMLRSRGTVHPSWDGSANAALAVSEGLVLSGEVDGDVGALKVLPSENPPTFSREGTTAETGGGPPPGTGGTDSPTTATSAEATDGTGPGFGIGLGLLVVLATSLLGRVFR